MGISLLYGKLYGNVHERSVSISFIVKRTHGDTTSIHSGPWRIAGWVGSVVFDGVVTILTVFRAVRLRLSGHRVSLVETMLQDGIYYFSEPLLTTFKGLMSYLTNDPLQSWS